SRAVYPVAWATNCDAPESWPVLATKFSGLSAEAEAPPVREWFAPALPLLSGTFAAGVLLDSAAGVAGWWDSGFAGAGVGGAGKLPCAPRGTPLLPWSVPAAPGRVLLSRAFGSAKKRSMLAWKSGPKAPRFVLLPAALSLLLAGAVPPEALRGSLAKTAS